MKRNKPFPWISYNTELEHVRISLFERSCRGCLMFWMLSSRFDVLSFGIGNHPSSNRHTSRLRDMDEQSWWFWCINCHFAVYFCSKMCYIIYNDERKDHANTYRNQPAQLARQRDDGSVERQVDRLGHAWSLHLPVSSDLGSRFPVLGCFVLLRHSRWRGLPGTASLRPAS